MDTIKNYLDNVFSALTNNSDTQNLKSEIRNNIEEKYNELK